MVKADGLASGKGVLVASNVEEAVHYARHLLDGGEGGRSVVVEELLEGEEVSVLAFTDGNKVALMPPVQDHKRAFDDDAGPNTGSFFLFLAVDSASLLLGPEGTLKTAVDAQL